MGTSLSSYIQVPPPPREQNQESVFTNWWFDNFNQNVDSHTGKGAIDSIHIVEFSERNDVNIASSAAGNVPRSKRRSLAPSGNDLPIVKVDKKEPSAISSSLSENRKPRILMNYINFGCSEEFYHQKISFYPHFRDGVLLYKQVNWLT